MFPFGQHSGPSRPSGVERDRHWPRRGDDRSEPPDAATCRAREQIADRLPVEFGDDESHVSGTVASSDPGDLDGRSSYARESKEPPERCSEPSQGSGEALPADSHSPLAVLHRLIGSAGAMGQAVGMRRCHSPVRMQDRSAFASFRFPPGVIAVAVRWYLRPGLSYRDVEEMLAERGIEVDHVTVFRWVQRFTPMFADAAGRPRCFDGVRARHRPHRLILTHVPASAFGVLD
jgi:hypothetical protein